MVDSKIKKTNADFNREIANLLMSPTIKKLKAIKELEVKVNYYNDQHQKKLKKYPMNRKIESLIAEKKVSIDKDEFLTYLLFTEQRERKKLRTFSDFSKQKVKSYFLLDNFIDITGKSLRIKDPGIQMDRNLIERIGVAFSLCMFNKIYGLTEADWNIIPVDTRQKTMDFRYASDGRKIIEVEAKGSSIENNKNQISTVSKHKKSIEAKKDVISQKKIQKDKSVPSFAYGVISVLDGREDTIPQIWLLDPPPVPFFNDPVKTKLLNRLYFYWKSLKYISPNSTLLHALINRINVIEKFEDYLKYDGIFLLNRVGESIEFYKNTFARKSVIGDDEIIGRVFPFNREGIFFMGYLISILSELKNQNFNKILKIREKFKVEKKRVICRIRTDQMPHFQIPESIKYEYLGSEDEYIEFSLQRDLTIASSGRVFGVLSFK